MFPKDSIRLWERLLQTLSPLLSQVRLKRGSWPLLYQRWSPAFLPLIQRWSLSVKRRKCVPMVHFQPESFLTEQRLPVGPKLRSFSYLLGTWVLWEKSQDHQTHWTHNFYHHIIRMNSSPSGQYWIPTNVRQVKGY